MDNNNQVGMTASPVKKSKAGMIIVIIIIILAILALVGWKMMKGTAPAPTQSEMDLNKAVGDDTTVSITNNLNSIDVSDTSDADLKGVDSELNNL